MSGASLDPLGSATAALPLETVHELNRRGLELLVNEARARRQPPVALVEPLREVLLQADAEVRRRAGQRPMLLMDLRFDDDGYWQAIARAPSHCRRLSVPWRGSFPRRTAIALARSLLVLAWHSLRADREATRIMLGMTVTVARVIEGLPLADIDTIASLQYRHLQPRWADQPALWRALLDAAQRDQPLALSHWDVRALQLISGGLLYRATRPLTLRRVSAAPRPRAAAGPSASPSK